MKRIYISVPITGHDIEKVKARIEKAKAIIREQGNEPVSPLDNVTDYSRPWIDYIIDDLQILKTCDEITLLADCATSRGCRIEFNAAKGMNLKINYLSL